MTYDVFEDGLRKRGFVNVENVGSRGRCHKDEKHYILSTDWLIIYSNTPDYHNDDMPNGINEYWAFKRSEYDPTTKEFSFDELDEIMKI